MLWKVWNGAAALGAIGAVSVAQTIEVTFENLLASDSNAFTPVFFGVHDGGFDLFDPGGTVSAGLEEVAELGSTGTLAGEFAGTGGAISSQTTGGGPILGGQDRTVSFDLSAVGGEAFLTFATMVVPTNDLFIGNGNQTGIRVLNSDGSFAGPIVIEILGGQIWDAGTEVNNADNGAAFLSGVDGTAGEAEGGVASLFFNDDNAESYLESLVGRTTAPGFVIGETFGASDVIARITIVPTPGVAAIGLVALAGAARRRR